MPISIDEHGIWVGDGKGGMKLSDAKPTHLEITIPGLEHIVIDDANGIRIEKDPVTGMPIVHAESMVVASEQKPRRNIFQRLFRRKEG